MFAGDARALLPIPEVRETVFIDFATTHESNDLYIKNRALHSVDESEIYPRCLSIGGFWTNMKTTRFSTGSIVPSSKRSKTPFAICQWRL